MKRYTFVRAKTEGQYFQKLEHYQEVIHSYAAQGWRYVGFIPAYQAQNGTIMELDLVFETDLEQEN